MSQKRAVVVVGREIFALRNDHRKLDKRKHSLLTSNLMERVDASLVTVMVLIFKP